jgi:hypothetical protein
MSQLMNIYLKSLKNMRNHPIHWQPRPDRKKLLETLNFIVLWFLGRLIASKLDLDLIIKIPKLLHCFQIFILQNGSTHHNVVRFHWSTFIFVIYSLESSLDFGTVETLTTSKMGAVSEVIFSL